MCLKLLPVTMVMTSHKKIHQVTILCSQQEIEKVMQVAHLSVLSLGSCSGNLCQNACPFPHRLPHSVPYSFLVLPCLSSPIPNQQLSTLSLCVHCHCTPLLALHHIVGRDNPNCLYCTHPMQPIPASLMLIPMGVRAHAHGQANANSKA